MATDTVFRDEYGDRLAAAMRGPGRGELMRHVKGVMAQPRIMEKLELPHPGEQIFFGTGGVESDRSQVYKIVGVGEKELMATLRRCTAVDSKWIIANKPFNWALSLLIREAVTGKRAEDAELLVLFMAVSFYSTLQFKYFRRFYQPQIMAAAMNGLSDKFILKGEGTILRSLHVLSMRCHQKYKDDLVVGRDQDIFKYFVSMWSRINGFVKSLKSQYEEAKGRGSFMNTAAEFHDSGDRVLREPRGGQMFKLADDAIMSFVGEPLNGNLVTLAARISGVPPQPLTLALNTIREGDVRDVREIVSLILEMFHEERSNDVRSREFLAYAHSVFARSNTKDGRVERIKAILDALLREASPQYLRTNREATKSSLRKGIFIYLVVALLHQ